MNEDGMKSTIQNLEKQISYSNRNITMGSKVKADSMVKAIMVEKGLTENQAYAKVYDEVYRDELERIRKMGSKKKQAEIQLFYKTNQVLTHVEFETWDEEKLDMYKTMVGDDNYNNLIEQFGKDIGEVSDNEVAQVSSGSASFITQDVVTNVADCGSEQVQNDIASKSSIH